MSYSWECVEDEKVIEDWRNEEIKFDLNVKLPRFVIFDIIKAINKHNHPRYEDWLETKWDDTKDMYVPPPGKAERKSKEEVKRLGARRDRIKKVGYALEKKLNLCPQCQSPEEFCTNEC